MSRVWLVTGTSTGFGRAIARAVLARGDRLVATARRVDDVADLAAPGRAIAVPLDVTDPAAVQAAVDEVVGAFGRIDVVVNNAGYGSRGAFEEFTDEQIRDQFEVNVFGAFAVTRAVLPVMRAQGSGHVIQMSSLAGVRSALGGSVYSASKFALEGMSEGLAAEVAPLGIAVTMIEPGPFRTDFAGRSPARAEPMAAYDDVLGTSRAKFAALHGTQPGDPERAAQAVEGVVDLDDPPLRLPLGASAFDSVRETLHRRLAEVDAVEHLGRPTDYPPSAAS
ncbi:MAG: 3-oxoacyl-[acyl-carrier protein] reductase [uncultured Actinomycetospora sp.]|uniref:3-oxoacyl-[acyl-carrier protein] reductase n=1 Tax=uncultured Actinomycetospora sp. TaxID=1135996 RepID=A0A6J4HVB8_9PSEU|nr:MAG: 3-oxoacyl-[acyl-carrier protein] reductase [uncultured Actinomycetospora sp.]